jgi:hypothetical protein
MKKLDFFRIINIKSIITFAYGLIQKYYYLIQKYYLALFTLIQKYYYLIQKYYLEPQKKFFFTIFFVIFLLFSSFPNPP